MYSDPNGKHTECGAPNCCFCRKEYRDFINANVDWYNRVTGENILGVDFSGNFVYPAKIEIDKESTEYKVLRSTGIFFESFEASADAGFGVGYEKIILKVINLEATSKAAVRAEISGHSGFDIGTYGGNSFGVSAWDVGIEGGTTFFDSFITGERKVNVGSERSISYSSGIYVLVGFSYSVGFNYGHFMDETSKVW